MIAVVIALIVGAAFGAMIMALLAASSPEQERYSPPIRVWFWKDGARQKEFHPTSMKIRSDEIRVDTIDNTGLTYDPDDYDEITIHHKP